MNAKNVILVTTIAAVFLVAAVGSASADHACVADDGSGDAYFCGGTVMKSCTLNGSMTCNDHTASGLISGASNIVIDGAGSSMTGNRGAGCSVSLGFGVPNEMNPAKHAGIVVGDPNVGNFENVMIKNLEIKNFCTGIAIGHSAFAGVNNIEVRGCKIHDNGENSAAGYVTHGVHMVHVHDSIVTKNDIYSNTGKGCGCGEGGHGIFFYGGDAFQGRDNTITCNNLYNNRRAGFWTKKRMNKCTIAYNNVTGNGQGGIVFRCANTRENVVIYNNVSYNNGSAIYIGGRDNNVSYNTAIGNTNSTTCTDFAENPDFGVGIMNGRPTATNTRIHDNLFCNNEYADVYTPVGSVTADSIDNTCDTTIDSVGFAGCDFACTGSVQTYFDFDGDSYYSNDPENCVCANAMNTGSCCNPGLFNEAGASQHCAGGVCSQTVGNDPNDCDDSVIPELTYTISGTTTPAADTINITNLNNSKEWAADVDATGFYTLTLNVGVDVNATERLQIVACQELPEHESNCNVTTHTVETAPGEETADLTLNHYCLNYYPDYPYYTQEEDNWSGPAVMKACIAHYIAPPTQAVLNDTGITNNHVNHAGLLYVDPRGMETTMDSYLHPYSHNYGTFAILAVEDALHRICYWQKLGPGAVPAYGDYSNWMAVRGIHTSKKPTDYSAPYDYEVYGFWVNDPNPSGIGENSYKTATEFTTDYYIPTIDLQVPAWNDTYMSVLEPPEHDAEITIVAAKPRLADAITPELMAKPMMMYGAKQLALENVVRDDESRKIVKAAIDGVNEELVPYDSEFAAVFAKTVPGKPMLVSSDNDDYYVVPFNVQVKERPPVKRMPIGIEKPNGFKKLGRGFKRGADKIDFKPIPIEPIRVEKTLVVVLVDAEDGSFKEASWVENPVKYLPVSKIEAVKLVLGEVLDELHVVARKDARDLGVLKSKPTIELVYTDASPYYPDWKVTVNGKIFYVGQDGTVSN